MVNPYKEKLEVIAMVQSLPDSDVITVKKIIESFLNGHVNPMLLALALAPEDDEPLTPEEEEMIRQSRKEFERGEFVTLEEVEKELGL